MKDVYKYIACNYPEIEPHLAQNMYRITIDNDVIKTKEDLLIKSEGEIRMIPIVSGAWFFLAAALIGGGAVAATSSIAIVATLGSVLVSTGISMAVSGVTNMLFPQQQPNVGDVPNGLSETDTRVNFSFNGIQNVSRSGVCIPLIYGEVFTGSIVVSSGTDTAPVFKS